MPLPSWLRAMFGRRGPMGPRALDRFWFHNISYANFAAQLVDSTLKCECYYHYEIRIRTEAV